MVHNLGMMLPRSTVTVYPDYILLVLTAPAHTTRLNSGHSPALVWMLPGGCIWPIVKVDVA